MSGPRIWPQMLVLRLETVRVKKRSDFFAGSDEEGFASCDASGQDPKWNFQEGTTKLLGFAESRYQIEDLPDNDRDWISEDVLGVKDKMFCVDGTNKGNNSCA